MKFTITTEKGTHIEIDTEQAEGVVIGIDDKKYDISIKEIQ